jgi:hypothetical protein
MKPVGRWALVALVLCAGPVLAQLDCPSIVQAALDATDEQCSATARNQACYGNVNLEATPQPDVDDFDFSAPGDIVAVSVIERFRLSSKVEETGEWGVALMQLQANIPDTSPGQNVTFLLFGDVQITNGVQTNVEPVTFDVMARGNINVRGGPSTDDVLITGLSDGETLTAIGRNADGTWLQVALTDGSAGWVSAELVAAQGEVETLNIIDPEAIPLTPMQAFYFQSGFGDAPCAEAPDSGILVQTPEGVEQIQFTVNDVGITLGSTAYLQAQPGGDMTTSVVEGEATVEAGGASVVVPAGRFVSVPLDAQGRAAGAPSQPQPYDGAKMAVLPIRILPRPITIATPISAGSTAGNIILLTAGEWTWTPGTPSAEGCPTGVIEFVVADLTPAGTFQLPGGEFSWETFYDSAYGESAPPESIFSNPEPNTYVVDIPIPQFSWHYEAHVIDSEHIEGAFSSVASECSIVVPFEMTGESMAGILPAAGEWEAAWDPPSISCEIASSDLSGTLTWDMTYYESFRLPGDEFSPALLYGAVFDYDMSRITPDISTLEANTYVMTFSDIIGDVHFEVRVIDSDHMEGFYDLTNANCVFAYSFEMTRVGN